MYVLVDNFDVFDLSFLEQFPQWVYVNKENMLFFFFANVIPIELPIERNVRSSANMSHNDAPACNDHLDRRIVVLASKQHVLLAEGCASGKTKSMLSLIYTVDVSVVFSIDFVLDGFLSHI